MITLYVHLIMFIQPEEENDGTGMELVQVNENKKHAEYTQNRTIEQIEIEHVIHKLLYDHEMIDEFNKWFVDKYGGEKNNVTYPAEKLNVTKNAWKFLLECYPTYRLMQMTIPINLNVTLQ